MGYVGLGLQIFRNLAGHYLQDVTENLGILSGHPVFCDLRVDIAIFSFIRVKSSFIVRSVSLGLIRLTL